MKQTFKRSVSIFLAALLILTAAPFTGIFGLDADAAEIVETGDCRNPDQTWTLYSDGLLTITGTGLYYGSLIGAEWDHHRDSVKKVSISKGIGNISAYVFLDHPNLTEIILEADDPGYTTIDGVLYNKDKTVLIYYPAGKTSTSFTIPDTVTTIGSNAFSNCTYLRNIIIPDSVTLIDEYAFYNSKLITDITIPDSVKTIGYDAFHGCDALANISLPDTAIDIQYSFHESGYYKNESNWQNGVLYIGNHLIKAKQDISGSYNIKAGTKYIQRSAFDLCESLTEIQIPASVTNIGEHAFFCCRSLETVTFADNAQLTSIGKLAFESCIALTSIALPDSVTSIGACILSETAYSADKSNWTNGLLYCGNHLIEVAYRTSGEVTVKEGTLTLADSAFGATPGGDLKAGCEFITSIVLPDSLQYVGKDQFRYCLELTSITFGRNTKQIGAGCFWGRPELDIYYRGSSADWDKIEISYDGEYKNDLSNYTFHFAEQDTAFKNSDNAVLTAKGDLIGTDGTTVQALLQQAGTDAKLYKADGTEKKADAKIGTGDKLVLADGTELIVSVLGDINGDGEVATADARLVLRKAVNLETFDNAQNVAANVDNNKEVGVADARMILRASVNLDKAENWFADIAK